jgi:hypothetical protein
MPTYIKPRDITVTYGGTNLGVLRATLNESTDVEKFATSNTNGFKEAVDGNKTAQLTIEVKLQSGAQLPEVGSQVTVSITGAGTPNNTGTYVVQNVQRTWDYDSGQAVAATLTLESHGSFRPAS